MQATDSNHSRTDSFLNFANYSKLEMREIIWGRTVFESSWYLCNILSIYSQSAILQNLLSCLPSYNMDIWRNGKMGKWWEYQLFCFFCTFNSSLPLPSPSVFTKSSGKFWFLKWNNIQNPKISNAMMSLSDPSLERVINPNFELQVVCFSRLGPRTTWDQQVLSGSVRELWVIVTGGIGIRNINILFSRLLLPRGSQTIGGDLHFSQRQITRPEMNFRWTQVLGHKIMPTPTQQIIGTTLRNLIPNVRW